MTVILTQKFYLSNFSVYSFFWLLFVTIDFLSKYDKIIVKFLRRKFMESQERLEKSNQILKEIMSLIEAYNVLCPDSPLKITSQKKNNVRDKYICTYNDGQSIGLFEHSKQERYYYRGGKGFAEYITTDVVDVYRDTLSEATAIKILSRDENAVNEWANIGYQFYSNDPDSTANCIIENIISFDSMRTIMYSRGEIEDFEPGYATDKEILNVFKFAVSYYQLDKKFQKQKVKSNDSLLNTVGEQ